MPLGQDWKLGRCRLVPRGDRAQATAQFLVRNAECYYEPAERIGLWLFLPMLQMRDRFTAEAGRLRKLTDADTAALTRLPQTPELHV
jgi:hypothetical protein